MVGRRQDSNAPGSSDAERKVYDLAGLGRKCSVRAPEYPTANRGWVSRIPSGGIMGWFPRDPVMATVTSDKTRTEAKRDQLEQITTLQARSTQSSKRCIDR